MTRPPTPSAKFLRREVQRRIRREIYSPRWLLLISLLSAAVVALLALLLGHGSLLRESVITLSIISAALFLFLTVGFYRGVRIRREVVDLRPKEAIQFGKLYEGVDLSNLDFSGFEAFGDHPLGCLGALVMGLLVLLLLPLVLWLTTNLFWVAIPLAFTALYYVFSRSLRQVFLRSQRTRRNLALSLVNSLLFTSLYTSWFWLLLSIVEYCHRH
ncbi:MAG: hypothetical protein WCI73_14675 [Phycisphaerae bacterium]